MKTRRLLVMLVVAVVCSTSANAQSWLSRLKDKAVEKVKEKVENKVEDEVGNATDDVLSGKATKCRIDNFCQDPLVNQKVLSEFFLKMKLPV